MFDDDHWGLFFEMNGAYHIACSFDSSYRRIEHDGSLEDLLADWRGKRSVPWEVCEPFGGDGDATGESEHLASVYTFMHMRLSINRLSRTYREFTSPFQQCELLIGLKIVDNQH
jgi:hypothetical protein